MDYALFGELRDVNSVSKQLKEKLEDDFQNIIKPFLQSDPSKPGQATPKLLYQATVGTGKTHQMVGFIRNAMEYGLRVMVRAPTTRLAEEIACNINAEYPNAAAVWYGRERDNPDEPTCKMCPRHEVVSYLISLNTKPSLACGTKNSGYCEHHPLADSPSSCGYWSQDVRKFNVVVVAGDEMLTLAPRTKMKRGTFYKYALNSKSDPDLFGHQTSTQFKKRAQLDGTGDFDLILLDETDPLGMIKGISEPQYYQQIDEASDLLVPDRQELDILFGFSVELRDLIINAQDRHLDMLTIACGLPRDDSTKIDILEEVESIAQKNLRTPIPSAQYHKHNRSEIRRITKRVAKTRKYLNSVIQICDAMKASLRNGLQQSPALQVKYENGHKRLNICTINKISPAYGGTPFVIFDATPRVNLLEYIYGPISIQFERSVRDGPNVKRFQLVDHPLTYTTLEDERWAMRLTILTELLSRTHGDAGLICPMRVENTIIDKLDTSFQLNHFGALRGDNSFEDLPCVIIASRQAQHFAVVEDIAAVLSQESIVRLPFSEDKFDWYPKEEHFIVHRSEQSGWPVSKDWHPDPLAESVRASITDDNLEQAIGRTRNVRRYQRPLHEYIITNTPTSRLVDGVFKLNELKAVTSWVGLLLHAGVWIIPGKGTSILFHVIRGLIAQRRDSLYRYIIGDPAFETPEQAAKWRKDQLKDNQAITELVNAIDEALSNQADTVELLHSPFPVADFRAVKAKVLGSRYFAQLYVRTEGDETPVMALQRILGDEMESIEVK